MDDFVPDWRAKCDVICQLVSDNKKLREENDHLRAAIHEYERERSEGPIL